MDLGKGEQPRELLEAQAHIWNHIFNFINSMSLKCAIQLGIPDIIQNHGKPMRLSELIAELPIHPSKGGGVYRLMRVLVQSGFFSRQKVSENDPEEGYVTTHASRLLLKDNPLSMRPFLLAMLDPILVKPWHHVSTWFQNEDPTSFETAHGRAFWDYGSNEPTLNHFFNEAMASDSRLVASVLVTECKGVFDGLTSLVDVGGGTGTVAKAIADAFPNIECTVLDLPHVVADLQGSNNLNYVGGDMFDAIPTTDAILLKCILHDWSDEENVKILRRCKEAITSTGKKGKVVIIDIIIDIENGDEKLNETQIFSDVMMMVFTTGKEREEKEWAKLFLDAGFNDYKITPILGLRSLIEIFP